MPQSSSESTVTATGASARVPGAASASATDTDDGPRVTGFFHVGVTVQDMNEALRFYRDLLGLEVLSVTRGGGSEAWTVWGLEAESVKVAFLRVPGSDAQVELFEFRGIERHGRSARPCDFGAGHFCVFVHDAPGMLARARQMGFRARSEDVVTFRGGPHDGVRAVYLIDPDGYHVELYELPVADHQPIDR
jgi:lactoylglutathione lyase